MRSLLAWIFFVFPLLSAQAQTLRIDGITISNYGIYSADPVERLVAPETATGHVAEYKNFRLLTQTETVPGRKGLRFGVEYVVNGAPKSKTVSITWITRFPRPGLRLPSSENLSFNKVEREVKIGTRNYRVYSFDNDWEIVPGDWTFEFYYQDRKIGEKRFTVVAP